MPQLSKQALIVENNTNFPNNNTGYITPALLREFNRDMIDSLVDENTYNVDSASWNAQIAALNPSSSADSILALNAFTASQDTKNSTLASYTGSNDTKWSTLGGQTGSFVTESESGSFLISASVSLNTITFTKGNASTFSITVNTGSATSTNITSLNAYTASQDTKNLAVGYSTSSLNSFTASNANTSLNSYTASNDTKWSNLSSQTSSNSSSLNQLNAFSASASSSIFNINAFTGSQITKNATLATYTASLDTKNTTLATVTASLQGQLTNIGSQSGSWITESETASFARTNVNNNFSVNQTFTNITAISASFQYVQTTYETSSVIYSSGSNQLGDAIDDVQTLIGTVIVSGSQKITGSLDVSSTFTSSLQSGYVLVGNGSGRTIAVPTSSVGTVTDLTSLNAYTASQDTKNLAVGYSTSSLNSFTASNGNTSLNSYTASQDTKNSTLATYTASVDSQLSSLTNATASYAISSSVAAVDAAQQSQINSLIAATGSYITTPLTSLNAFTQSQDTKNSTLATYTASVDISLSNINSFTASNGNTSLNSYTASNDTKWSNLAGQTGSYVTSAITASSLVTASVNLNTITFTKGDASTFNITVNTGSGGGTSDLTSLNAFTASQDTKNSTLGNLTGSFATTGSNVFVGNQTISSSLFISGNINMANGSDLVTHHIKAAGSNGLELQNASSGIIVSMGAGGGTQASFTGAVTANSISASTITGIGNVTDYSTSVNSRLVSEEASSSLFATKFATIGTQSGSWENVPLTSLNAYTASQDTKNSTLASYTGSNDTKWSTLSNVTSSLIQATGSYAVKNETNVFTAIQSFSASLEITGSSPNIKSGSFSGSLITNLTDIYTDVAAVNQIVTLTSASYAGLASGSLANPNTLYIVSGSTAAGATLGSNTFNGSQIFTGSVIGNVVALSISSNTASMDLNNANYFTLTLADTATTHITATNIKPGTSATLVITTGTNSSASLAPILLQPSGSSYSATLGSAKKDVLSLVAVGTTSAFVVSTKNMI